METATAPVTVNDGTRTPSPQGPYCESSMMGASTTEMDVPSPVPASVSSTTSSEHGSNNNLNNSNCNSNHNNSNPNSYPMPPVVPNPFAPSSGASPGTVALAPGPACGWGTHVFDTGMGGYTSHPSSSVPPPPPPHPHHGHGHPHQQGHPHAPPHHHPQYPPPLHHHHPSQYPNPIPMVVSTLAPTPAPHYSNNQWARENSCPNFSIGTSEPKSPSTGSTRGGSKATGTRRRYSKKASSTGSLISTGSNGSATGINDNTNSPDNNSGGGGVGDSGNSRRQKRLERNRESARLSRRRRKHYLEILEERVTQLSHEVDQGRRAHASQAVTITLHKRREVMEAPDKTDEERVRLLEHGLGRTSSEMMLVTTFKYQQLKSFSLPPQSKFILWLTLQNDQYFRGGRAASERLSAARIGERMLNSGNDRVPPAQSMWPLFCNEVGLSYEQEEKVRNFQRTLLQSQESWLERHTTRAADLAMAAVHDSTQAMTLRLGQRERSMLGVLSPTQKIKLLSWAEKNRAKIQSVMRAKFVNKLSDSVKAPFTDERFPIDKKQHVAANLYIINHRLQKLMQVIPRAAPLVTGATLKKLSRRPSFESLGRSPSDKPGKDGDDDLSREHSFASSGSLKRSASVLSIDGDRPQLLQISPEDAEETCKPSVEKVIGHVKEIIPPTPPIQYSCSPSDKPQQGVEFRIPSPTQVASAPYQHQPNHQQYMQQPHPGTHVPMTIVSSQPAHQQQTKESHHKKQSSFIPPYLNVVPEEMFPNDGSADDFLMSLVDEDWAIGEGIDMDTSN